MRQRRSGARRVISLPAKMTRPASGRTVPLAIPNSVVLPAPLGPMMPSASPSATARSIAWATITAPNRFETLSKARMEGMFSLSPRTRYACSPTCGRGPRRGHAGNDPDAFPLPVPSPQPREKTTPASPQPWLARSCRLGYDSTCSGPPTGISGAVLLVVMTRSNLSPLRCHCPATSGVLVTFFTG